jgi:hypothetical protein
MTVFPAIANPPKRFPWWIVYGGGTLALAAIAGCVVLLWPARRESEAPRAQTRFVPLAIALDSARTVLGEGKPANLCELLPYMGAVEPDNAPVEEALLGVLRGDILVAWSPKEPPPGDAASTVDNGPRFGIDVGLIVGINDA